MRIRIDKPPFLEFEELERRGKLPWEPSHSWPCHWISSSQAGVAPFVSAYRCRFKAERNEVVRIHVSGDERYELYLDGIRVGRGSERGTANYWYYETYDLSFDIGEHVVVARTWSLGSVRPWAQMTVCPGFLLAPEKEAWINKLGTGVADWEAMPLDGYSFSNPAAMGIGTGGKVTLDGQIFPWGYEQGAGNNWQPVTVGESGNNGYVLHTSGNPRIMKLAGLPAMQEQRLDGVGIVRYVAAEDGIANPQLPVQMDLHLAVEAARWKELLENQPLIVPPHSSRRIIIDLGNYYCLYPELVTSGGKGAVFRISWEESLYEQHSDNRWRKGNRREIEGKYFRGIGDTFVLDGGSHRLWDTLWWHAGTYMEINVVTLDESVTIEKLALWETRYPLEAESKFRSNDEQLQSLIPIAVRTLQMCAHETYMDCPYWEQLMYVGDTRLELLLTYALSGDDRLARKALVCFDVSRLNYTGLPTCAFPDESNKIIPSFCLWWIAMVYDYALWRGDPAFVNSLMLGVRNVIGLLLRECQADGLIAQPKGWAYIDWIEGWSGGNPPDGGRRVSAVYNWQMVYTLKLVAALEAYLGEEELAKRADRQAGELSSKVHKAFWDEAVGLYADDETFTSYSEHAQCMAVLSDCISDDVQRRLQANFASTNNMMASTSIYYSHYLFEAYAKLGLIERLHSRLEPWFSLREQGFYTTPEHFGADSRSDCHAWGAHPLTHFYTSIAGIRPATMGFEAVKIQPKLGHLQEVEAEMVHPQGVICVEFRREGTALYAMVDLPGSLAGTLEWEGITVALQPGKQSHKLML